MQNIEQLNIDGRSVLRRPTVDPGSSKGTLVLLHGYGADEHDLMGLASYFDPGLQVVSIRAPGQTPFGGAAWFDIDMAVDGSLRFNADQALESCQGVIDLINTMQDQSIIPEDRIILGGFSQGASISNLATFKQPGLIKALLIMSGRLTKGAGDVLSDPDTLSGLPVFAGHGTHDQVIPIEFGREIVSKWQSLPASLRHFEYPMGHEINQDELRDILTWFQEEVI